MIKIRITKLDEKNILIEQTLDNGTLSKKGYAAHFSAGSNEILNTVTISTKEEAFTSVTVGPAEIEINGHVPASAAEARTLLNAFIGGFNTAGGAATTTLQEMKETLSVLEDALTWK
jgi:hypothetical protein